MVSMKVEACRSDSCVPVRATRTSREGLDVELAAGQVLTVDVRDLELAARGRPEGGGDVDNLVVVEIEAVTAKCDLGLAGFSSSDSALPSLSSSTTP